MSVPITPERWREVKHLLEQAIEIAPDNRQAFLDQACSDHHALRKELESLLSASDEVRSSFLQSSTPTIAIKPGTKLGDYEVQKLIGSGGMGEVYRAHDSRLKRDVAIKVLPPFVANDPDRLRRFEQEARAAAALNHPNILAVHQLGTYEDAPYLVSELLEGTTLRDQMRRGPLPPRKAIEYGVQIARGLAAAHEKGIAHRDLKPENLFVTKAGHVKILDFGLAKLTSIPHSSDDSAPTIGTETDPGVVMGTVGYMSPEQVRGQAADYRTDIFAFGAILYEMLSGKRAFQKSTSADTMSAILNEEPAGISQLVPDTPPALRRIVHRCLEKNPEQRFQSASDLAFALEALSDSGSLQTEVAEAEGKRRRHLTLTVSSVAIVGTILIAGGILYHSRTSISQKISPQGLESTRVTHSGNARMSAISPDARYLAYTFSAGDREALSIRQLSTGSEAILVPPTTQFFGGITFSLDGDYIYYCQSAAGNSSYNDLYRLPVLGGTPVKLIHDIDTPVAFSPDGKQVVFVRGVLGLNEFQVVIAEADGQGERVLTRLRANLSNGWSGGALYGPAWSPDGSVIAFTTYPVDGRSRSELRTISVKDGSSRAVYSTADELGRPLWLPYSKGLIVPIAEYSRHLRGQLWYIPYPAGQPRRITDDTADYDVWYPGVSRDGTVIADSPQSTTADLWIAHSGGSRAEPITSNGFAEGWVSWTHNGEILYGDLEGHLYRTDVAGRRRTLLNPAGQPGWALSDCGDGQHMVFVSYHSQMVDLWRMDADGSNLRRLPGTDDAQSPQCSPDGKTVVYQIGMNSFRQPLMDPGARESLGSTNNWGARISPDGKLIAFVSVFQEISKPPQLQISRFPEGPVLYEFEWQAFFNDVPRWAPDSKAIQHIVTKNGVSNIWEQRLSGGPPKQITDFNSGRIFDFEWSPDGKYLAFIRGTLSRDVVLIRNFQ